MKKFLVLLSLSGLFLSNAAFADFKDVSMDNPYAKAILWMQNNGIVKGYGDGTFKPDQKVNRAEFLKMLYWAKGEGEPVSVKPSYPFADVKGGEWYASYIEDAYLDGIINGYPDGTFMPGSPINTVEALKIVLEGFLNVDDFQEAMGENYQCVGRDKVIGVDKDAWFYKYVNMADGICSLPDKMVLNGKGEMIFDAGKDLTRAQMAELSYRVKAVRDNSLYDVEGSVQEYAIFDGVVEPKGVLMFDPLAIKIGDKLGNLIVSSVGPIIPSMEIGMDNYSVGFDGEITVSGKYYNLMEFADWWCFDPDYNSDTQLPKAYNKTDGIWLCFNNHDFVEKEFGKHENEGNATIKIKNFSVNYAAAEVTDSAELVEVIFKDVKK